MSAGTQIERRQFVGAATMLVALSGCGPLLGPQNPPGQIYVLSPTYPPDAASSRPQWQLAVALPTTSASLATNRIALRRDQILDYYADAQWTDPVPQLFENLLVGALNKGGAMGKVSKDLEGVRADFMLQSEISAFEARYDANGAEPTIVIEVSVKLVSPRRGEIVDAGQFESEAKTSANSVPAVVGAFDSALSTILPQICNWVLKAAHEARR